MQASVKIAEAAARKAGKIIIRGIENLNSLEITQKNRNDFATEIDRAAEKIIIEHITQTYPDHKIIAEESGEHGPDDSEFVWVIDPLDGTTNYIHGFPHFCVSIAQIKKDKLEHGVIYDPIRDEMFTASRGHGAHLNGKRMRVTETRKLEHALLGTGFPFKHPQHVDPYLKTFQSIFPKSSGVRRSGSAALDLAYVAAGRLDGFWEISLNLWDMAAGILMIKEAGGLVSDFHGGEKYLESGNIIAGNPKVFKNILQIVLPSLES